MGDLCDNIGLCRHVFDPFLRVGDPYFKLDDFSIYL